MGLINRASRGFTRAGEETVRVVDYDAMPESEEERPQKQSKPAREPKQPREKRRLGVSAASKQAVQSVEDDEPEREEPAPKKFLTPDTAFEIDENEPNFYEQKQTQWEESTGPNSDLTPKDGAIQDVLDVLKIPATYTISDDILMPSDFEEIDFDLQVPQGYDVGQVQYFLEKAEGSVREYLKLLEARNEHIAKLATTVDRFQVDANNLKYDSQIAAGIGIIPTSESVDLENENMELKLQLQKMKDSKKTVLNSEERRLYEEMRNELSRVVRENEDLKEKTYELKSLVAQLEEDAEEMITEPSSYSAHDSEDKVFQAKDAELPELNQGLPDLSEESLPDFSMPLSSGTETKITSSSFDMDKEDVDSFLDQIEAQKPREEGSVTVVSDEDDDELDKLMRDWKN